MRKNPDGLRNYVSCETCMKSNRIESRQALRCGYEPPAPPHVVTRAWTPAGYKPRDKDDPATCPGYTVKLPEVAEITRARLHYKNSALVVWLRGEPATDQLLTAIEILESASNEFENLRMTPAKEGGLRE